VSCVRVLQEFAMQEAVKNVSPEVLVVDGLSGKEAVEALITFALKGILLVFSVGCKDLQVRCPMQVWCSVLDARTCR
jgi:stage III sporulation protein SpoIIIAA